MIRKINKLLLCYILTALCICVPLDYLSRVNFNAAHGRFAPRSNSGVAGGSFSGGTVTGATTFGGGVTVSSGGLAVNSGQTFLDNALIQTGGYGNLTIAPTNPTVTGLTVNTPALSSGYAINVNSGANADGVLIQSDLTNVLLTTRNTLETGAVFQTFASGIELYNGGTVSFKAGGGGVVYTSGANGRIGTGLMSAGTCTITNSSFTSSTLLEVTPTSVDTNSGQLAVTSIGTGTATITSSNAADDNSFNYRADESQ